MSKKLSSTLIQKTLHQLMKTEEGLITLLTGSLLITDFDDFDEALKEAVSAFNNNRGYFSSLKKRWTAQQTAKQEGE